MGNDTYILRETFDLYSLRDQGYQIVVRLRDP